MDSKLQQHIRRRFCPLVKYTFSNGQYWDGQRFVSLRTYYQYIWCSSYYVGQGFQVLLAGYLTYLSFGEIDIPEITVDNESLNFIGSYDKFIISIGIVIWLIMTCILCLGSLTVEYQDEITETINQAFRLDSGFKRLSPSARLRSSNNLEKLVPWICWIPLTIPFLFGFAFFHPSNPIRSMIGNALEIELTFSNPLSWLLLFCQTWGVTCLVGVVMGVVLPFLIVVIISQNWLLDASFEVSSIKIIHKQETHIETKQLGTISVDEIILIYRSLQMLTGLCNIICKTITFAYHSAGAWMIFVFSSYTLIKKGPALLSGGSIMSISLAAIIAIALFLCVFIFFIECSVIDELETRWKNYKSNILTSMSRKTRLYKSALSFRTVTVMTTYPFCNVNRSTFLDWMDAGINNIVSLLLI